MRKVILILFLGFVFSGEYEDTIYLNDGSVISGMIVEIKPNEYYKIQSNQSIVTCYIDDIYVIKRELIKEGYDNIDGVFISQGVSKDRTWSLGLGFATNRLPNFIHASKDFKVTENSSLSVSIGLPYFGLGLSSQSEYNQNGLILSVSFLSFMFDGDDNRDASSISVAYQWRLGESNVFLSLGVCRLSYKYEIYQGWNDILGSSIYDWEREVVNTPIISFDVRL